MIVVTGGIYHERAVWPDWDQYFGSGGRAAAAMVGHVDSLKLVSYASPETAAAFTPYAKNYGFALETVAHPQSISFEYVHSLSTPEIIPSTSRIKIANPLSITAESILRFGFMEGSAKIDADRCVYDPQSPSNAEPFGVNGSRANHLAVVANQSEVIVLGGSDDPIASARSILEKGAEVVVVKSGAAGAFVVTPTEVTNVPPYKTDRVWTIGSGDVFAAIFAAYWAVQKNDPRVAADSASRAVASYVDTMALPIPTIATLAKKYSTAAESTSKKVYLAGPFFNIGQRWLIDDVRRRLLDFGMTVFSPVHDVGPGPAEAVAPADLAGLDACDVVFAILDGIDSGTMFEIGYARAASKPVFALAQSVTEEDLKMPVGSGCIIYDDLVTAIHHVAWHA